MGIRKLFVLMSFGFCVLAALTAVALVIWTNRLEHLSELSNSKMQSVKDSYELQVSLLRLSRASLLRFGDKPELTTTRLLEHESAIRTELSAVHQFIDSPEEREMIDRIESLINQYIDFVRQQSTSPPKEAHMRQRNILLDEALGKAKALAELNARQADELEHQIGAESRSADLIAGAAVLLSIIGLSGAWFAIRRWFFLPITSLSSKIDTFSVTDPNQQIKETGPIEIRSIAAAFNRLAARVLAQREASLRFLAAVAHDLRNPLGAIRMSSELLSDEDSGPEEREAIVQIISRQAQQLDRMVGDLLDTTRIEAGQLEVKRSKTDLSKLVRDSVMLNRSVSHLHTIDLRLPSEPVYAEIDPLRISQVLNNLLSNAIKYSPNGGDVRVRLRNENKRVVLEVEDTGIGISEDEKDKIFEPFRRSNATRDTIPGVGLGLSVSKRIIAAHSGSIEVESSPGEGSIFRIRLPALTTTYTTADRTSAPHVAH